MLQRELGISFIYVTHNQSEAFAMADWVVVMNKGVVEQIGRPAEIYNRPATHFVAEFVGANNIFEGRVSATAASVIGFLAAYALNRFVFPGRLLTATILILPILIPPLILGVSLLGLLSRLGLHGQSYSIIIAHTLLLTAPAMAIIQLRLAQMPSALEEAAWDLGANELQTIWRVVLPWAMPGIAGGWLLAFTFSFDEFIIAWFVSGFDQTLPVAVYNVMIASHDPSLNAIGTIVFGMLLLTLLGAELLIIPLFMKRRTA